MNDPPCVFPAKAGIEGFEGFPAPPAFVGRGDEYGLLYIHSDAENHVGHNMREKESKRLHPVFQMYNGGRKG